MQESAPACRVDRFVNQFHGWGASLGVKVLKTEIPGELVALNGEQESSSNLIFRPTFTVHCESKETRKMVTMISGDEEMFLLIELKSLLQASDAQETNLDQFMTSAFKSAVSPLADEICKDLVPGLAQSLCLCLEHFSESERNIVFEMLIVKRYRLLH